VQRPREERVHVVQWSVAAAHGERSCDAVVSVHRGKLDSFDHYNAHPKRKKKEEGLVLVPKERQGGARTGLSAGQRTRQCRAERAPSAVCAVRVQVRPHEQRAHIHTLLLFI
jgi:hypothetical protein